MLIVLDPNGPTCVFIPNYLGECQEVKKSDFRSEGLGFAPLFYPLGSRYLGLGLLLTLLTIPIPAVPQRAACAVRGGVVEEGPPRASNLHLVSGLNPSLFNRLNGGKL